MTTHSSMPGESHGQRSLAGYSPQGRKESDTTEAAQHAHMSIFKKVKSVHSQIWKEECLLRAVLGGSTCSVMRQISREVDLDSRIASYGCSHKFCDRQKHILSQFWRPQVQNQGACRTTLPPVVQSLPLTSFWKLSTFLDFASVFIFPSLPCVCHLCVSYTQN